MFKFFKFIQNVVLLNERLAQEEEQQKREGYLIESIHHGPEHYFTYYEGSRELSVGADFTWLNDVRIYTQSFVKWDKPRGEELTQFDYQKVLNRLVKYFSCWGGEVILDDCHLQGLDEIKAELDKDGIEFQEVDGVIIYKSTLEEERKRKSSVFND